MFSFTQISMWIQKCAPVQMFDWIQIVLRKSLQLIEGLQYNRHTTKTLQFVQSPAIFYPAPVTTHAVLHSCKLKSLRGETILAKKHKWWVSDAFSRIATVFIGAPSSAVVSHNFCSCESQLVTPEAHEYNPSHVLIPLQMSGAKAVSDSQPNMQCCVRMEALTCQQQMPQNRCA